MAFRQDCGTFASFSINFSPKNAQEKFYDKKKKQRRLLRYQIYLDCWIDVHSSFTILICVLLLTCFMLYVHWHGHQVYIVKRVFFMKRFRILVL